MAKRTRGPKTAAGKKKATAAYVGKVLLPAFKRFQPGGKAYKALKSHGHI
jgi:hypothetical protein